MKKWIPRFGIYVLLLAMLLSLIPAIGLRVSRESQNKNVTISVLYNDIRNKLSPEKCAAMLTKYKEAGISAVSLMEEDLNSMVARGTITCIKYNVLRHKYDKESMEMAEQIAEKCPLAGYDSYIIIAGRDDAKEMLRYTLPRKYSSEEFASAGSYGDLDMYVLYDGRPQLWDYTLGYEEDTLRSLSEEGFDITLVYKVKNYAETAYLDDIARLVRQYNIKSLNIKADNVDYAQEDVIKENYTRIADIIQKNDLTLVVTENPSQLSNQESLGYDHIFAETMIAEGGTKKVLRAYETYDDSQADETHYKYRVAQYFNSTVDRNIRFITLTQVAPATIPYEECASYTLQAATEYKNKIEELGFSVNEETQPLDYIASRRLIFAICAAIMVLAVLLIGEMVFGKILPRVRLFAVLAAILAFGVTFIMPTSLLSFYPTFFCMVQSCFAMTAMLYFTKRKKDTLSFPALLAGALSILLSSLLLGAVCMGSLLSGIDYYVNNSIFRGIKLSLIVPVFYTAVLYYFLFIRNEKTNLARLIKDLFYAEIKVCWVLIGGVILAVGSYYILRSGNVNSISFLEHALRTAVTEIFPARPRTKEFLIGYPMLMLFLYYMKNSDWRIVKWLLAVATSILAASITNSFCHVFTDFSVILARTLNGLLVGVVVSVFVYVANLAFLRVYAVIREMFMRWVEKK